MILGHNINLSFTHLKVSSILHIMKEKNGGVDYDSKRGRSYLSIYRNFVL